MTENGSINSQIASQLRGVYFGGNWAWSNLRDHLSDVTWQQAMTQVADCNTILKLVFHLQYYTNAILKVLQGKPLTARDKDSWLPPAISSQGDWNKLLDKTFGDAEKLADLIGQLPEDQLWDDFDDGTYGNYHRNLHGIIEHIHYHLGQIVMIKKLHQRDEE